MAKLTIDDLITTGETVFFDNAHRENPRYIGWYERCVFNKNSFQELDENELSLVEARLVCEQEDYSFPNVLTVNGVHAEKLNFANIVRSKALQLKKRNTKNSIKYYSEEQLKNIHDLMISTANLAREKIYFPNDAEYSEILNNIRAIPLPLKRGKMSTRETDQNLVSAGIHYANRDGQAFIISKDKDIPLLANQYFKNHQIKFPLSIYLVEENFNVVLRACSHY